MGVRGPKSSGKRNKSVKKPKASNYRLTTRWLVDYDYVSKLSPEDQAWLAQFTDEYYAGDFSYDEPLHADKDLQLERYRAQNYNWNDAVTRASVTASVHGLDGISDPDLASDQRPVPKYQGELEYKAVLQEYRALIEVKNRSARQEARLRLLGDFMLSLAEAEGNGTE